MNKENKYFVFVYLNDHIRYASNCGAAGVRTMQGILAECGSPDLWVKSVLQAHHLSFADSRNFEVLDYRSYIFDQSPLRWGV